MVTRKIFPFPVYQVFSVLLFLSCATIAKYDQYAYSQATSIKVDALGVMDLATGNYSDNQSAIKEVTTAIDKMYEYEKNRPKNEVSEKMWGLLRDSSGHLYGGFIQRWRKEGKLDKVFIDESKRLIGASFDQISQLESGKIKPAQALNQ
ncbi:MAG: hypothetical protein INR73_25825 [Williamsia sp.]|nr:hypothetical protein [Williamsia sp.]